MKKSFNFKSVAVLKNMREEQTDAELVARWKDDGDMNAVGALWVRYSDLIFGVSLKYLRNTEDAKDACSDIFEELPSKLLRYQIEKFAPWLHRVVQNHCLMRLRKEKSGPQIAGEEAFMYSADMSHQENDKEDDLLAMEKCIDGLADSQKQALTLFYLQGKSYDEVSRVTATTKEKVRSDIQNGRRNMRNCLEALRRET